MAASPDWDALARLPAIRAVADSIGVFAAVESLHIVFIALIVGCVLIAGLAGAGLAPTRLGADGLTHGLRWPYRAALTGAGITGALLFATSAQKYLSNPLFITKLLLFVAALTAHAGLRRAVHEARASARVRAWAVTTLLLWLATVTAGRWIGLI